jgi:hypothetical protein
MGTMTMGTTTGEPMSSSDARAAILSSHDELRGLVSATIRLADGATAAGVETEPLRAQARELYDAFTRHMEFEERLLPMALRDVIGLGPLLEAEVVEGHDRRRAALAAAMSSLGPGESLADLVDKVRTVADTLLFDLESEETCLLTADLDALAADTFGG